MDVRLPRLGEGAESGTVVNILVSEGDEIEKDQSILELENEKAVAPIPSPASGTVSKIHVKEGDEITVGQVLISLSEKGTLDERSGKAEEGAVGKPKERASAPEESRQQDKDVSSRKEGSPTGSRQYESNSGAPPPAPPSIRKIARDLGIDLTRVRGSERGGRINLGDVRAYIQRLQEKTLEGKAAPERPVPQRIDFSKWGPVKKERMSSLRRTVAQRMRESWSAIPHITQFDEADITWLMELKEKYGPAYEKKGARLTLTPFALKAAVLALKKYPVFNSSLDESTGEIVYKEYYHLGVAVDTEAGLIAPVIRNVDRKGLLDLSIELAEIAERARKRKVSLEELQGGTFTLSNQGGIGGSHFTPIIHRPEVSILGLGRAVLKPAMRTEKVEARMMLPLCLSYDHRIIDGADAARFIRELVRSLENFKEEDLKA